MSALVLIFTIYVLIVTVYAARFDLALHSIFYAAQLYSAIIDIKLPIFQHMPYTGCW